MTYYMFGIDRNDPAGCAADLRGRGFDAVVLGEGDVGAVRACADAGLSVYLCVGAFAAGEFCAPEDLAMDVRGEPRLWFSSACPNHGPLRRSRFDKLRALAGTPGIQGVLVDGARFASPGSAAEFDAFWTCFCPRCLAKAADMGFDVERMAAAVRAARDWTRGNGARPQDAGGLAEWLNFRRACVAEYMRAFDGVVKSAAAGLLSGAFVFAPSLARLVGQDAPALEALDILAPMLYRRYPGEQAAACLNHEWATLLLAMTKRTGLAAGRARSLAESFGGLRIPEAGPEELRRQGFPSDALETETARALRACRPAQQVWPIIQLEDDELERSCDAVRRGGAQGLGFFAYREELLPPPGQLNGSPAPPAAASRPAEPDL